MAQKQRLKLDLESLFPSESITICNQAVSIRPLNLKQLALIISKANTLSALLKEKGITWDNFKEPQSMLELAVIAIDNFPEILSECTNIEQEDLEQLPIDVTVELIDKTIEVNMKSKENLEGNLQSLAEKFKPKTKQQKAKRKSRKPSRN